MPHTDKFRLWKLGSASDRPWERVRGADRGTLFQLEDGATTFCHLVVINCPVVPGAYRGRHYHLKKLEDFFLANGRMLFVWYDLDTRQKGEIELIPGDRLFISPRLAHSFLALEQSTLVEYSNSLHDDADSIPFDPCNPQEAGGGSTGG
jgi:dTDP-4-dehydrorhamnose 3,5-epimerase-like enzyme